MSAVTGPVNFTVMWLTFRQLFTRKRLIFTALFAAAPLVIALFFRASHARGAATDQAFMAQLYGDIVAFVILPLSAVVFGTAAFGGEIDDGTIVYLLVKSLPRWTVVISKYLVAVLSTVIMMAVAVTLPWLALGADPGAWPLVQAYITAMALGAALYCAIFVTLGMTSKRALVFGLLYVVVIEITLSPNIPGLKSLSVREYVMTMVGTLAAQMPGVKPGAVSIDTVWTMSAVILVAGLALGMRWLSRYEMAERL
jgi:ABC-2 type transport system permease protein